MVVVSPSPRRIQEILNHLEITFMNCRFIYSDSDDLPAAPPVSHGHGHASEDHQHQHGNGNNGSSLPPAAALARRRSTLASIQKWVHDTTAEILSHNPLAEAASACSRRSPPFVDCIFPPGPEEAVVRQQIAAYESEREQQHHYVHLTFNHCIFVRREFSLLEELIRMFKRLLGIRFEVDFVSGSVKVEDKKCKLKDIPWIVELVTQQIEEDAPKHANEQDERRQ